jgi:hypothetical protein
VLDDGASFKKNIMNKSEDFISVADYMISSILEEAQEFIEISDQVSSDYVNFDEQCKIYNATSKSLKKIEPLYKIYNIRNILHKNSITLFEDEKKLDEVNSILNLIRDLLEEKIGQIYDKETR